MPFHICDSYLDLGSIDQIVQTLRRLKVRAFVHTVQSSVFIGLAGNAAATRVGRGRPLVLSMAEFILLYCILFSLTIATADTLGGRSLVSKCSPRPKVLASFAPFDLQSLCCYDPDSYITSSAKSLILSRNNVRGGIIFFIDRGRCLGWLGGAAPAADIAGCGTDTEFTAHDAIPLAGIKLVGVRSRRVPRLNQIVRIIDKLMKIWKNRIFGLFGVSVQD